MKKIDIDGYSIKYLENGSGEPILFVHGSASDYRTWQSQQVTFSGNYRTISYSRRYHWPNEPISNGQDYSMYEHVQDLKTVLRNTGATPAHLVGHSYGAIICLLVALQEPKLVRSLVLSEPPVITLFVSNSPKPWEILKLLISRSLTAFAIIKFGVMGVVPATAAARRNDMEEALRRFGKATLGADAFHDLSEARLNQVRANLIKAEFLGSGFPPLDAEQLRTIQIPTLLVSGQKSPKLFHHLLDRLQQLFTHAERIEIPGASHIIHEDNALVYNTTVMSFLSRHR